MRNSIADNSSEAIARKPKNGALILKAERKSYADLLKAIKKTTSNVNTGIKSTRKTKNGDVLTLEGNDNKVEEIKTAKAEKIQGVETRTMRRDETILMYRTSMLSQAAKK